MVDFTSGLINKYRILGQEADARTTSANAEAKLATARAGAVPMEAAAQAAQAHANAAHLMEQTRLAGGLAQGVVGLQGAQGDYYSSHAALNRNDLMPDANLNKALVDLHGQFNRYWQPNGGLPGYAAAPASSVPNAVTTQALMDGRAGTMANPPQSVTPVTGGYNANPRIHPPMPSYQDLTADDIGKPGFASGTSDVGEGRTPTGYNAADNIIAGVGAKLSKTPVDQNVVNSHSTTPRPYGDINGAGRTPGFASGTSDTGGGQMNNLDPQGFLGGGLPGFAPPAQVSGGVDGNQYRNGVAISGGFASGTSEVPGQGSGAVDTVDAKLAPHEAVLNAAAADHVSRPLIDVLNALGAHKMAMEGDAPQTAPQPTPGKGMPAPKGGKVKAAGGSSDVSSTSNSYDGAYIAAVRAQDPNSTPNVVADMRAKLTGGQTSTPRVVPQPSR